MEPVDAPLRAAAGDSPSVASAVIRGLAVEHAEFVDRLAVAPTLLPGSERNLGEMLAFQARLTRQFFDLQRQLLERCAVLDAQVAAIDAAAVAGLDGDDGFLSSSVDVIDRDPSAFAADEVRQALAALATTVVTTPDDVASLAKVLDDAFAPDEFPFAEVLSEFASTFDRCWSETNRVAQLRLADAQARAAMLLHFANVEQGSPYLAAPEVHAPETTELATPPVSTALADLDALLAQFDDGLELTPTLRWVDDPVEPSQQGETLITFGSDASQLGDGFWDRTSGRTSRPRRRPMPVRPASSSAAAFVFAIAAFFRLK